MAEKSQADDTETIDLTYLIDGDFQQDISYDDEIPAEKKSYRIFGDKITADLQEDCRCGKNCGDVLKDDPTVVKKVQHIRAQYYMTKQGDERTNKTLDLIRRSLCGISGKNTRQHNFEGHIICMAKWMQLVNISKSTYYRALTHLKTGNYDVETVRKNGNSCYSGVKGQDACGFIECCLEKYGDYSPEREKIILPPCVNRRFIYEEYLDTAGPHLKIKQFYHLFHKHFLDRVCFAKTRNINPCDICLKASTELPKLVDQEAKYQLKRDLKIHLDRQCAERKDYYKKKQEAHTSPLQTMSVIVDGMDQSKTNIPHFRGWCRAKTAGPALKTHITGTIVHGSHSCYYIDFNQYQHDPNLTITCLINVICKGRTSLPPKLYIQCDNCGRENKNKYVLGFLSYLCLAGYVKEVFLSFLLKGHTHEDIDQRFSKISQHMRQINAMTLPQLEVAVKESFRDPPHIETIGKIWNVKDWLSAINDISNHSFPHQFWMFCDRPNHVNLKTRMWSTDEWTPSVDETPLEIFELDDTGNHRLPTGVPSTCKPNYLKLDMEHIKAVIEKMKMHLSFEEYQWWKNFTGNPNNTEDNLSPWPLSNMETLHLIQDVLLQPEFIRDESSTCIRPLLDIEEQHNNVVTKQRKRKRANDR